MSSAKLTGLVATLILAITSATAVRAEEAKPSKTYVVLVGIDKYADKQITPRKHAEADAKALYDLFADKDHLSVEPGNLQLFLGSEDAKRKSQPATHANVLKALHGIAAKAGRDDLVLFAFFGQGAPLGEQACYFCADSTLKGRAKNSLTAAEIEHEMQALKSQRLCVFVDVSFRGFDSGKEKFAGVDPDKTFREFLGIAKDDDEEEPQKPGRVVFAATDGLTQSLDLKEHGLFAKVLIDALKGAADHEGYEPDGVVTVDELVEYVNKKLPEIARENGKTDDERQQQPLVLGATLNHFVLTHNPAVMAKVNERLAKLAQLAKDKKISPELAEEGQNLLSRMPRLEAQRKLRKEYQKLADGGITPEKFQEKRETLIAGMKLDRKIAENYARKVLDGAKKVKLSYVKDVTLGELIASAIRGLYRQVGEKIPAEISQRLAKAKTLKEPQLRGLLTDARERLGKREDLADHKDINISMRRLLGNLDPYSTYYDKETLERFKQDVEGQFVGIGVQVRKHPTRDALEVISPIYNSPSYNKTAKKVLAGDLITGITLVVDDKGKPLAEPKTISTKGMSVSDAVAKIKGKAGTKVRLTIEREGENKPVEVELTRGQVEVETVLGLRRKPNDEWDHYIDAASKIAYIRLTQFSANTYRDLNKLMKKLDDKQGIKGLVLDLRFNPGGYLESSVDIADMFIDDGLIVTVRPRKGEPQPFTGKQKQDRSYLRFPMACLVNGRSASASEIVSACLQDHNRAIIVGERTYGKGSVQESGRFDGGELKLTVATYWRPSGKNIHKGNTGGKPEEVWGVLPNKGYLVKQTPQQRADLEEYLDRQTLIVRHDLPAKNPKPEFKDHQLDKAVEYVREQIKLTSKLPAKKAG
jgi:C-terminal peptidase prc